jgi:hypothetical protein
MAYEEGERDLVVSTSWELDLSLGIYSNLNPVPPTHFRGRQQGRQPEHLDLHPYRVRCP